PPPPVVERAAPRRTSRNTVMSPSSARPAITAKASAFDRLGLPTDATAADSPALPLSCGDDCGLDDAVAPSTPWRAGWLWSLVWRCCWLVGTNAGGLESTATGCSCCMLPEPAAS